MSDLTIVAASPEHEGQILALGRRALGWADDPRVTDLYRWKHDLNPAGRSPRWVALDGDRVVGFRVMMRWRFSEAGSPVTAVRAVDTATDPAHQGRGVFRRLTLHAVETLTAEGVDFVFNTPNSKSRPGYLKMGWVEWGRPPVGVLVRPRSVPRVARARTAAEHWSQPCSVGMAADTYFASDEARIDLADRPEGRLATEHSRAFLTWRYGLGHLRYRALTTGDLPRGERLGPGVAVFRTRRRGPALEATVSELLAPRERARRALVRAVLSASGADYALVGRSGRPAVDLTPTLPSSAVSPLLTWRALARSTPPDLGATVLSVGDLELF